MGVNYAPPDKLDTKDLCTNLWCQRDRGAEENGEAKDRERKKNSDMHMESKNHTQKRHAKSFAEEERDRRQRRSGLNSLIYATYV